MKKQPIYLTSMMHLIGLLLYMLLWTPTALAGNVTNLLPKPQHIEVKNGDFRLGKTRLVTPVLQETLSTLISEWGGSVNDKASSLIEVQLVPSLTGVPMNQNEAYQLSVNRHKILVKAETENGVYYAFQTLRQLGYQSGKRMNFTGCEITDWPAFRVRGFMQDIGRGYYTINELKQEIDMLSRFKINVFHWHLTENQAWRLESKIFPMLNDSVNMSRLPGKFYTLEEARNLVEFCKARKVLLIPEIDMPGHSAAFVRCFRHDMQSPEGMKILKLLVEEVCENLDVPYLHIGTDEVQFKNPTFVKEMVAFVRALGKKAISWNPGWHYAPGEIDMTHLWSYRGKAQKGIPAIDSRFHYLNHFDTFGDLVALYNSKIYNAEKGSEDLAGVIVAIWNDRIVEDEKSIIAQNNFYPNMLAIAERAWLGGGSEYFDKNGVILPTDEQSEVFRNFADFERRMLYYKNKWFQGYPFVYVKQTNVKWNITDAFPNGGDLQKVFPPEKALSTSYSYEGKEYGVRPAIGAGIYLRHVWGNLVPAFYRNPQENHTAYAYTYVYSPKQQEVGLWAEFQNYGRSEADIPPMQGTWDYKGSRIWINDKEILPPTWTATHTTRDNEIPLGNENFTARAPQKVTLHKGWNKVFMKLPVGKFQQPQVRLVKWMFTAVFVTLDGENAVDGLIYSPEKKK